MSELSGSQLAAGILQDEEENVASPRPGVLPFMQPVVNGNHDATGRELGVVPPVADTSIMNKCFFFFGVECRENIFLNII